jgi:hypothetical protein
MAFVSIQQPTLANSVVTSTTANASTFYIANAPAAGTNQTITNAYALNVNAGKVRVGGILMIPTGASNGFVLSSDASGNASWSSPSAIASFNDGTVSAPGIYYAAEPGTGFYRPGAGQIGVALTGVNYVTFTTTATNFVNGHVVNVGSTGTTSTLNVFGTSNHSGIAAFTGTGSTTAASSTIYSNPASTAITGASSYFFNYFNSPTTVPTTFTGEASTVFIAGAPTSTTGGTGYALNVSSGNSLFTGNVTLDLASSALALSGASSIVTLANTTASTTSTTGALQCAGGGYFGAGSLFAANLTLSGAAAVLALSGATSAVTLANTAASTSSTTGALRCLGGGYFGTASIFAANLTLNGASAVLALSGASAIIALVNAAPSTSPSTGALQCAGGCYFGANSIFAANLALTGASASLSLNGASSVLALTNAAPSTSSTTGALRCLGGGYFGANSLFAGNLTLNGTSAVLALSGATSSLTLAGAAAATSSTTGSLTNAGGVGIAKNLWVGSSFSNTLSTINGAAFNVAALTYTDTSTAAAGTAPNVNLASIRQPTFNATNAVTTTEAVTFYIEGAPIKGANETFTNVYGLFIDTGATTAAAVTEAASLYVNSAPTVVSGTSYAVKVNAGTTYLGGTLQIPTGAAAGRSLISDASGNASWGLPDAIYSQVLVNSSLALTNTAVANIAGMTITPTVAGVYSLRFHTTVRTGTANRTVTFSVAVNGTLVTSASIAINLVTANFDIPVTLSCTATVNGTTDVITIRSQVSAAATYTMSGYRYMFVERLTA